MSILQNEYAARVHDLRTYHSISMDLLHRWVYPLVPDSQLLTQDKLRAPSAFRAGQFNRFIYKDVTSRVSRSATLAQGVVIGADSTVSDDATVRRSVIGRGCTIGAGASVVEAHVWDGAVVGAGALVTHAILGAGVVVGAGAVVPRGCVLSAGAVVGEGVVLPEYTRVSMRPPGEDSAYHTEVLGPAGVGYVWVYEGGDDYGEEETVGSEVCGDEELDVLRASSLGCAEEEALRRARWTDMPPPEEEDDEGEEDGEGFGVRGYDEGFDMTGPGAEAGVDFARVVGDMVATGLGGADLAENTLMEIKGFKFAQNKVRAVR